MKRLLTAMAMCAVLSLTAFAQSAPDPIQKLGGDIWTWRARFGQYISDDINRMERPMGVVRDWSAGVVAQQRKELSAFEDRGKKLADPKASIPQQVDYRLLGSALARVRWELDVVDRWAHDPNFYVDQTITPVAEVLTIPGPFDESSSREILARPNNIPAIAQEGEKNLSNPPARYAQAAIDSLADIRQKLTGMAKQLAPYTTIPVLGGVQIYTKIPVPVLAIYAFPRRLGPEMGDDPASRDAAKARMLTVVGAQIKAFRSGVSSARVAHCPMQITIFYRSNEADVLREINLFGSTLK